MNCQVLKPNSTNQTQAFKTSIFLAGSIEMGKAEDWQTEVQKFLSDFEATIFNPRRDEWDASWKQESTNPLFNQQVNWEIDRLEDSDIIFLNLINGTLSPITILELGMFCKSGKMMVCCPEEFWRNGNVEIVCHRNGIPLFSDFNNAVYALMSLLNQIRK